MRPIIIFFTIFIILSSCIQADLCQETIISGEECLVVTPVLECTTNTYTVYNNEQTVIDQGDLTYFANDTYYFNFLQEEGEYLVKLSCANWTNTYYVVSEDEREVEMNYPSLFGVILLFLIIIGLSLFLYFHNKDDMWLQGLSLILALTTFIFLIIISISVNEIQIGYQSGFSRNVVGDTDYNSLNISYLNVSNTYKYLMKFDSFNDMDITKITDSRLCFKYNNTDASNIVYVTNENSRISNKIYIQNSTENSECIDFKNSKIYNGAYLGIACGDCNSSNSLGLGLDNEATDTIITISNNTDYTLSSSKPLIYEIRSRYPPFNEIRNTFFTYLWILGFFVLAFGIRSIILVIIKTREVVEE